MTTSRSEKAIWNILTQKGYKTHVVGWWPSHPAEPVNGVFISNFYQKVAKGQGFGPLPKGTVHPASDQPKFAALRVHPSELTGEHIYPFVPDAHKIDQRKDKRLYSLAKVLCECTSIHAAATPYP